MKKHLPVVALCRDRREGPEIEARVVVLIQQRSWMGSLALGSVWRERVGDLDLRSMRMMRPWRSPTARMR